MKYNADNLPVFLALRSRARRADILIHWPIGLGLPELIGRAERLAGLFRQTLAALSQLWSPLP